MKIYFVITLLVILNITTIWCSGDQKNNLQFQTYPEYTDSIKKLPSDLQGNNYLSDENIFDFGLPEKYHKIVSIYVGNKQKFSLSTDEKNKEVDGYILSLLHLNSDDRALKFAARIVNQCRKSADLIIVLIDPHIEPKKFSRLAFGQTFTELCATKQITILENPDLQNHFKQVFLDILIQDTGNKFYLFPIEVITLTKNNTFDTIVEKKFPNISFEKSENSGASLYNYLYPGSGSIPGLYDDPLECINPFIDSPLVIDNNSNILLLIDKKYIHSTISKFDTETTNNRNNNLSMYKKDGISYHKNDAIIVLKVYDRCYVYNTQINLPIALFSYFLHLQQPHLNNSTLKKHKKNFTSCNNNIDILNRVNNSTSWYNSATKFLAQHTPSTLLSMLKNFSIISENQILEKKYMQLIQSIPTESEHKWLSVKQFLLHPHAKITFLYSLCYGLQTMAFIPTLPYTPVFSYYMTIKLLASLCMRGIFKTWFRHCASNVHHFFFSPYSPKIIGPILGVANLGLLVASGIPELTVQLFESIYEKITVNRTYAIIT